MTVRFSLRPIAAGVGIAAILASGSALAATELAIVKFIESIKRCDDATVGCTVRNTARYRVTYQIQIANYNAQSASVKIQENLKATFDAAGMTYSVVTKPTLITAPIRNDLFDSDSNNVPNNEASDNVTTDITTNPNFTGNPSDTSGLNPTQLLAPNTLFPTLGQTLPGRKIAAIRYTVEIDTTAATAPPASIARLISGTIVKPVENEIASIAAEQITTAAKDVPVNQGVPVIAYLPPRYATTPVGDGCPTGTTQQAVNLTNNGDFAVVQTNSLPVSAPTRLIANSFYSDASYVGGGVNPVVFPLRISNLGVETGSIALATHSLVQGNQGNQQHPLPNGSPNFLIYAGNASGAEQRIWRQMVTGLKPLNRYLFVAHVSPINLPGKINTKPGGESKIHLLAQGEHLLSAPHVVAPEQAATGDVWTQLRGSFEASGPSLELAVSNVTVNNPVIDNNDYGTLALAGLQLFECYDPTKDTNNQPTLPDLPINNVIPSLPNDGASGTSTTAASNTDAATEDNKIPLKGGGTLHWPVLIGLMALAFMRRARKD
ncbi:MAG: hypothetical protein ACFCUJ_12515 [Thiotrichales bacterium]